jgi:heat shock protein HtpX
MLANMLQWAAILGGGRGSDDDRPNPLAALAVAIIAPIIAAVIQFAISRSREYMADAEGARICRDPLALASALRKIAGGIEQFPMEPTPGRQASAHMFIASPFRGRDVLALLSTHPPIEDRIRRLEQLAGVRRRV